MDSDNAMASALKRKRDLVEGLSTPKKAKAMKSKSDSSLRKFNETTVLDAVFKSPANASKATPTKGVNGNGKLTKARSKSPEELNFEDMIGEEAQVKITEKRRNSANGRAKKLADIAMSDNITSSQIVSKNSKRKIDVGAGGKKAIKGTKKKGDQLWKLSESIGGRLISVDPVFTQDEKYAIVRIHI